MALIESEARKLLVESRADISLNGRRGTYYLEGYIDRIRPGGRMYDDFWGEVLIAEAYKMGWDDADGDLRIERLER